MKILTTCLIFVNSLKSSGLQYRIDLKKRLKKRVFFLFSHDKCIKENPFCAETIIGGEYMPEALISLPDSNLAVDTRYTGSKTKKAGDSSGSTETQREKTESFSEVKRNLEKKTEPNRPVEKNEKKDEEVKETDETSLSDSNEIVSMVLPYVHPEMEAVPSLENSNSDEAVDSGAIAQSNSTATDASAVYVPESTDPAVQSDNDTDVSLNSDTSTEQQVYEEMDNVSIAARSFSESVSTAKNNPAKSETTTPQETTAASTGDPLDKLFQKDTGEPTSVRDTAKAGEKSGKDSSEQVHSVKTDTLSHDFSPLKGDLSGDIMEKNILGNFRLREFFNSINGKTSLKSNGLNSLKASLESAGNNASGLKLNAVFQDGDSSGKLMFNINTGKEMLKINGQTDNGSTGLNGFKNLLELRAGGNMKKISGSSHLNENAITDSNSTVSQSQVSSAEIKDDHILPTVSKERFTDYFVSKVREFFPDSADGKKILKVIITPPDLGEVKVTMEMKKSVLSASFHCTPEAARAINSQVQNLSKSLSNVGIQLGSSNIDTGQQNSNSQNSNHSQGYNHSSKSDGEVFPLHSTADEGISVEDSKVFNVLI